MHSIRPAISSPPSGVLGNTAVRDVGLIVGSFGVLSLAYWAALAWRAGASGFPLDDAFIHLQFARNLVRDGQMAFHPGLPSSGTTAPLYPLLLSLSFMVVRDWYLASYVLGAACSLASVLLVYIILRQWTGDRSLARWGGVLATLISPTIIQAYNGMEGAAYSVLFLWGLALYARPATRLYATLMWALCVWLRPEFLMMPLLMVIERRCAARRLPGQSAVGWARELIPHALIWITLVCTYCGYHYYQDGHWVPSTFSAKAVGSGLPKPSWTFSLPAALEQGRYGYALFAATVWPAAILFSVWLGLALTCWPIARSLQAAIRSAWNDASPWAAARRMAVVVLIGYPLIRGVIDTVGIYLFQQQRYYAHLMPLAVLLFCGVLGSAVSMRMRQAVCWALAGFVLTTLWAAQSVDNINDMQVRLAHWLKDHTADDHLIATNDIGAMAFISERPILDTVGLVEPQIVDHYLEGGALHEYLRRKNADYVIVFPNWYPDLVTREDLLTPVHSVRLNLNVSCGGDEMVVYAPSWVR